MPLDQHLQQLQSALSDRYDIEREIGAGGMATVFLARDLRHDRKVALKLLKPDLGAVLGAERFLAEIKVTANLQHPNLLPLFDSGAVGGLLYYVMPYVEGESLRVRLDREKQLPIDEALRIAVAIANALDYAHSHGVIHRDLKPENILLQHGQPVVADFGIALAVSNAGGHRITQTGLSLGTPQYMSPEQATGDRAIDGRSDLYSLAAMTYEMLTGEAPHTGTTSQAIIARLLTDRPRPMRAMRSAIPEHVEATILHALEKLPADRFTTAREFAEALQGKGAFAATQGTRATVVLPSGAAIAAGGVSLRDLVRHPAVITLAAVAVAGVAAAAFFATRAPAERADRVVRYLLSVADSTPIFESFPWPAAISDDGSTLVYSVTRKDGPSLYVQRTDQLEARLVPGTVGGAQPAFSPDGEWLVFQVAGTTRRVRLDGGPPVVITSAGGANGIDWTTRDEIILGAEGSEHGLSRVRVAGGDRVQFTTPDSAKGETDHLWPIAFPDGRHVVFAVWSGTLASATLAITSVDDGRVTPLGVRGIRPLAVVDGILVYLQADGMVMGALIDARGRRLTGSPVPVHDPVQVSAGNNGNSGVFVSRGGALVASRGGVRSRLVWLTGASGRAITSETRGYWEPRIAPDGSRIALTITTDARTDVWIHDMQTSTLSQLSSNGAAASPVWGPGGREVFYIGNTDSSRFAIWSQASDGGTPPVRRFDAAALTTTFDISSDGKWALLTSFPANSWGLFRVRLDTVPVVETYVNGPRNEAGARFSPDGKWVAFASDESGRNEIYVRSFPDPVVRVQISSGGGIRPVWSADGTRLYYRWGEDLLSARLAMSPLPRVLSRDTITTVSGLVRVASWSQEYDVTRDGRILGLVADRHDFQLVVVPNWRVELKSRIATTRR